MKTTQIDYKKVTKIAVNGVIFTIICIALVVLVGNSSKDNIKANQRQNLINELHQLVDNFDNDIIKDSYTKSIRLYGNTRKITVYPAKKHNKIFAKLIKHTYPKGYSGDIEILTAIDNAYGVIGIRILKHSETPGLGDNIEIKKSQWVLEFNGVSLDNKIWKVKKDGGDFDSFTGATITPRAVVSAVKELVITLKNNKL